jgi:hypothetical protein
VPLDVRLIYLKKKQSKNTTLFNSRETWFLNKSKTRGILYYLISYKLLKNILSKKIIKTKLGIICVAHSCGIFLNFNELSNSESKHEVNNLIEETIDISRQNYKFVIYDDACHLFEFINNRKLSFYTMNMRFFIDKFHQRNHKREVCKTVFNLNNNKQICHLNSVILEQNFAQIIRYKKSLRKMNKTHFNFLLLCCFDYLNTKRK